MYESLSMLFVSLCRIVYIFFSFLSLADEIKLFIAKALRHVLSVLVCFMFKFIVLRGMSLIQIKCNVYV